jgi:acetyltransferase
LSTRNLDKLLHPASVAIIGASDRAGAVGTTVYRNVLAGNFHGPAWPVNLRHASVAGQKAHRTVADLPAAPDLAVICTPPATVPGLVAELGAIGTRAAIVITAVPLARPEGRELTAAMLAAARPHCLRILGPNCVGLLVPGLGLNASFAHVGAKPGRLAFVSQSGALTTAMLDYANRTGAGFSHFISLGNSADVDFGDLLDALGSDAGTRAILLYMEAATSARKFMSAARAAARNKPVIVVKSGRSAAAAAAAASHTGALAGSDQVYDAAFRRAGMLRVGTTRALFDAAAALGRIAGVDGDRLMVLSNGGGPGVMAIDALVAGGGRPAVLSAESLAALDALLPATWSRANPVDIIGDAPAERYAAALRVLGQDAGADAILLIHAPTAIVPDREIAAACAPALASKRKPVLACWMAGDDQHRRALSEAMGGPPSFETPEEAVAGFLQLANYRRNQQQLLEVPPSLPEHFEPDRAAAGEIVARALAGGGGLLTEPEAKRLLAAYCIPVIETEYAPDRASLPAIARRLGFPLALKIASPDVSHKSDVGGVALDLESEVQLLAAADAMRARLLALLPDARPGGFSVQRMARRPGAQELILGAAVDPTFGPVLLFGQGGTAVETIADRALALPPLNVALARELIGRTRVYRLLAGARGHAPARLDEIELALVKLSQLVTDLPEVVELDINPLLVGPEGVVALDARVRIERAPRPGDARLAIRPYPKELEEEAAFEGGRILLRPIRPEDRRAHEAFLSRIEPDDMHARFFRAVRELPPSEIARYTQIDYDREMAFVAVQPRAGDGGDILGVARAHADPNNQSADFAIIVRSDLKGRGLGDILLGKLIRYCRARGTGRLVGQVFAENSRMLGLAHDLGFRRGDCRDGIVDLVLELQAAGDRAN